MPSIRRCFICQYKYDPKNSNIMMHSFPSIREVKQRWMKVCDMFPVDNVTNLYVCSKHFRPQDYYKPHSLSTKYKLKIGAVPSKNEVNTIALSNQNQSMSMGFESVFIKSEVQDECSSDSSNVFSNDISQNTEFVCNVKTEVNSEMTELTSNMNSKEIHTNFSSFLYKKEPDDTSNSHKTDSECSKMNEDDKFNLSKLIPKLESPSSKTQQEECSTIKVKDICLMNQLLKQEEDVSECSLKQNEYVDN